MRAYWMVFLIAMIPLIELRGAIPIGIGMGLGPLEAIGVAALGNLLPVPFIYMFARKFLVWGSKRPFLGKFCSYILVKGEQAGRNLVAKTGRGGLIVAMILFVGIPLPGTGAWNATLAASLLNMGRKSTAFSVFVGVLMASGIMVLVSMLGLHIFGL